MCQLRIELLVTKIVSLGGILEGRRACLMPELWHLGVGLRERIVVAFILCDHLGNKESRKINIKIMRAVWKK